MRMRQVLHYNTHHCKPRARQLQSVSKQAIPTTHFSPSAGPLTTISARLHILGAHIRYEGCIALSISIPRSGFRPGPRRVGGGGDSPAVLDSETRMNKNDREHDRHS